MRTHVLALFVIYVVTGREKSRNFGEQTRKVNCDCNFDCGKEDSHCIPVDCKCKEENNKRFFPFCHSKQFSDFCTAIYSAKKMTGSSLKLKEQSLAQNMYNISYVKFMYFSGSGQQVQKGVMDALAYAVVRVTGGFPVNRVNLGVLVNQVKRDCLEKMVE